MAELIRSLEESQPSPSAALTIGIWNQVYCDNLSGGITWGDGQSSRRKLIGRVTGRVTQRVLSDSADDDLPSAYEQRATFGRGLLEARLVASVTPKTENPLVWSVDFETFSWRAAGIRTKSSRLPPGRGGEWRTTYVDQGWRVMRAGNRRDDQESTYVLRRV